MKIKKLNLTLFTINLLIIVKILTPVKIFADEGNSCNPAYAKELQEISKKQLAIIGKDKEVSLEDLNDKRDGLQAELMMIMSLKKIKNQFDHSKKELEKINLQNVFNQDTNQFIGELESHIKNVAAHNIMLDTLDTAFKDKTIFTKFIEDRKAQNKNFDQEGGIWNGQYEFYNHMKSCDQKKDFCQQFLANLSKIENHPILGKVGKSEMQKIIDNYGELMYYATGTGNKEKDDAKVAHLIKEHKKILQDNSLTESVNSSFAGVGTSDLSKLLDAYGKFSGSNAQEQIGSQLVIRPGLKDDGNIKNISETINLIKSKCKITSVKNCREEIGDEKAQLFIDSLSEMNQIMADKGLMSNTDAAKKRDFSNAFNDFESTRDDYFDQMEKGVMSAKKEFEQLEKANNKFLNKTGINSRTHTRVAVCNDLYKKIGSDKLVNLLKDETFNNQFQECEKFLDTVKLEDEENEAKELQAQINEVDSKIKEIIGKDDFKELEILKATLYTRYYDSCVAPTLSDDQALPRCSQDLYGNINSVDEYELLAKDLNGIQENVQVRNYLSQLGYSDHKDKFSDPSYWYKVLNKQCAGYTPEISARADDANDDEDGDGKSDKEMSCGFQSCNACKMVYNLGKNAIERKQIKEYEDLPMHHYREYDRTTKRMVTKKHPISSIAAHGMKYFAMKIPEIGAPIIQTKKLQGQLWYMGQNAIYQKQMINWNNQYREKMYQYYDLRNPNLFGGFFSSSSTAGFPVN